MHLRRRTHAHFLHIGKTGGTAVKEALRPRLHAGRYDLVLHPHEDGLRTVPEGEPFFFVVRDPIERFVSGFNSRKRCGRPRYDRSWRPDERVAFEKFASADELACALSSVGLQERIAARRAMRSIGHVRESYWRWFEGFAYFEMRQDDLLVILSLTHLEFGFESLCSLLGLAGVGLPTDDVSAHRTPPDADKHLSDLAVANLTEWYADDFEFVEYCSTLSCFAEPALV